ncbi:MAG: hypothetical protein O3B25_16610, partial [Verrucomicrobia bacterium]|nr:hypothetical protein [Verrucomicrobiota bacterium]
WLELQGRSVKGSTLTSHKVDRVVNAPKSDDAEEESAASNKVADGNVSPKSNEKPAEEVESMRESKPAGSSPVNRLPEAKDIEEPERQGSPNKFESDGQATLDI